MAVDVCYSDNFVGMISPRLSFSRDLEDTNNSESTAESISNNGYICALESTFDFAFNVDDSVAFASTTSADELFSDGKIIPTSLKGEEHIQIQPNVLKLQQQTVKPCLDLPSATPSEGRKKSLKEFLEDGEDEEEPNSAFAPKSFWKFRRSNSLNCDRNQRKGLMGSWKILSRSGSTGKFLEKIVEEEKPAYYNFHQKILSKFSRNNSLNNNSENVVITSDDNKGLNRSLSKKALRRSHSTSDQYFAKSGSNSDPNQFRRSHSTGSALKKQQSQKQQHQISYQKGKVKDNNNNSIIRGYYGNQNNSNNNNGNSLKVNPMLNLPSPYISRVSVDLLGFSSLFCNGSSNKDRKKRK